MGIHDLPLRVVAGALRPLMERFRASGPDPVELPVRTAPQGPTWKPEPLPEAPWAPDEVIEAVERARG